MIKTDDAKYVVFWDIGNVLIKFRERKVKQYLEKNKLASLSNKSFINSYREIMNQSFLGQISLAATWKKLFDLTNLNKEQQKFIKGEYKLVVNNRLIKFMKSQLCNCDHGIISDLHQIAYHAAMHHNPGIFKICLPKLIHLSNQIGSSKNTDRYKYLKSIFSKAGNNRHNIIFVDDAIQNVRAAKSLGVNAILFPKAGNISSYHATSQVMRQIKAVLQQRR
jgi:FMN phosphatase YigB (HAD superfamily)